jgi:hypothetical protein
MSHPRVNEAGTAARRLNGRLGEEKFFEKKLAAAWMHGQNASAPTDGESGRSSSISCRRQLASQARWCVMSYLVITRARRFSLGNFFESCITLDLRSGLR